MAKKHTPAPNAPKTKGRAHAPPPAASSSAPATEAPPTPLIPKTPTGRRPKLSTELTDQIVTILLACGTVEDACYVVGVDPSTLHRWKKKGEAQRRGRYRAFLNALQHAIRQRRINREARILSAGKDDWRAIAWMAERTEPQRYAPRVVHHVTQELASAIERLKKEFADDHAALERALVALAGGHGNDGAEPDPSGEIGREDAGEGGEAVQPAPAEPETKSVP